MSRLPMDPLLSGFASAEDAQHLVLPFAASQSDHWWPITEQLPPQSTANLRSLVKGMRVLGQDGGEAKSLTPPHERILAKALGWARADGLVPWAAWLQSQTSAEPPQGAWGLVNLCHWAMGREHATLSDPALLKLDEADSRQLMEAMRPYFEEDGLRLHYLSPLRWLAQGDALAQPTASLDRVLGRNVDPWLPSAREARTLRRLQNEMQMLLYTHPLNEARQQRRELSVNSLWFSGTGALQAHTQPPRMHLARPLAQAALAEDWPAYAQAWAELDDTAIRALLRRQQAGEAVRLSLCGESASLTLETAPAGLLARLTQLTRRPAFPSLLQGL